ncbi:MAG: MFS transporter [Candidatus Bathyarchaeota archaeon]|nr:MFS transporter [Candidatus Bathyarchaeota archaeon]
MKTEDNAKDEVNSRRNIFALGVVSFFTDFSSEMVFSILPTFLLSLPGGSRAILGFIEGFAEALGYALRSISGIISDKIRKRKLLVLVGYGVSNVVKPLFAVTSGPLEVLTIRVADRVGKAVRTSPRDALLAESVSKKHCGAAFGLHRTLDQTGAIVGPVIASAVMLVLGFTMRDVFWLSLIPGTAALIILVFFVKERVGKAVDAGFQLRVGVKAVLNGHFSSLLVVVSVFSLGAFNFSFILLNAQEAGVADSFIPIVYAVVNVAHAAISIPAGVLSDRIGKEKGMLLGYGLFLLSVLLILFLPVNGFNAFLVAVFYGAYFGIVETLQRAIIPEYVDSNLRGTAYGIYYLLVGTAFFVSNTVVGSLWEYFGASTAAVYSIATSVIAIALMTLFLNKKRTPSSQTS